MGQWLSTRATLFAGRFWCSVFFFVLIVPFSALSQHSTKIPFPYGPMGLNSMPWIVAKEANLFEKNGLNLDMIFVGVSTVMVQSMLSGSANVAGLGGPAVVSNAERRGHHTNRGDGTLFHPVPDGSSADYRAWRSERKKSRHH